LARFDVARFCNVKSRRYFGAGFYLSTRNAERGYPETSQFKINKTWSGRRAIRPARRKSTWYRTMKPLSRTHPHVAAYTRPKPYVRTRYGYAIYVHLWTETRRNDR